MLKTIKKLGYEDVYHLGIVFSEEEVKTFNILINDKLPIDESQFLKEVRK